MEIYTLEDGIVNFEDDSVVPDLDDRVTVISGFPHIGKTTAMAALSRDSHLHIVDLESTAFRATLTDEEKEHWEESYVEYINSYYNYFTMRAKHPMGDARKTHIIMVSSHEKVRKLLGEKGIPFYYVVPSLKQMDNIIAAAMDRITNIRKGVIKTTQSEESARQAYLFLKNEGKAALEQTLADHDNGKELKNQELVVLKRGDWLLDWIMGGLEESADRPLGTIAANVVSKSIQDYLRMVPPESQMTKDMALDGDGNIVIRLNINPRVMQMDNTEDALHDFLSRTGLGAIDIAHTAFVNVPYVSISKESAKIIFDLLIKMRRSAKIKTKDDDEEYVPGSMEAIEELMDALSGYCKPMSVRHDHYVDVVTGKADVVAGR